MREEVFFEKMEEYFRNNTSIPFKAKRTYPVNNYVVLGNYDKRGEPIIIFHQDSFRGSVACYYVVFKESSNPKNKQLLDLYANHIVLALETIYKTKKTGYALYRKTKETITYKENSRDSFTKYLKPNHEILHENSFLKFLFTSSGDITNKIKWVYVSKHVNTMNHLNLLRELYNQVDKLSTNAKIYNVYGFPYIVFDQEKNSPQIVLGYKGLDFLLLIYKYESKQLINLSIRDAYKRKINFLTLTIELDKTFRLQECLEELIEQNKFALLVYNNTDS